MLDKSVRYWPSPARRNPKLPPDRQDNRPVEDCKRSAVLPLLLAAAFVQQKDAASEHHDAAADCARIELRSGIVPGRWVLVIIVVGTRCTDSAKRKSTNHEQASQN